VSAPHHEQTGARPLILALRQRDEAIRLAKEARDERDALAAEVRALREAVDALRDGALVPGISIVIHAWAEGWTDQMRKDLRPEQIRLRDALEALVGEGA
jgi:hypothetical protein